MPEGRLPQEAQWSAELQGRGLSSLNQVLPLLVTLQLLVMEKRGLVPQTLPAPQSLYQPLGTGPCYPHHKTPSNLTLQVHGVNAAPAPGLCPASTRLWRGTCSRKLLLIVSSDAVLPGQGNRAVSEQPCLPL